MHSLQTYNQDESVYDNKAYTITSIYHGGQLKIYTSHPGQLGNPESRPEYYMNQINTWGMTGNAKTFREGATAFRNARDWAEEQRNEAIKRANKRADDSQAKRSAVGASFSGEASLDEPSTLSQQSQISPNEGSNTTANLQESETSTDELALKSPLLLPAKRSGGHSKPSQRKRRNARESNDGSHALTRR
jgi:hypothetical protein